MQTTALGACDGQGAALGEAPLHNINNIIINGNNNNKNQEKKGTTRRTATAAVATLKEEEIINSNSLKVHKAKMVVVAISSGGKAFPFVDPPPPSPVHCILHPSLAPPHVPWPYNFRLPTG